MSEKLAELKKNGSNGGSPSTMTILLGCYGNVASNGGCIMLPVDIFKNYSQLKVTNAMSASDYTIACCYLVTSTKDNIGGQNQYPGDSGYVIIGNITLGADTNLSSYVSQYKNYVGVKIECNQGNWGGVRVELTK